METEVFESCTNTWDLTHGCSAVPSARNAAAALKEMPEYLKQQIRQWLESRRAEYVAERRAEAEARMRSYLPDPADGSR